MARDTSKLVTIPGELHSAATGNIVTAAEEVFDYNKNKYQKDINQEIDYIKAIGYYECSTPGSTAAKAITIDSSVSLSTKILCKVKFVEKNTANSATMNINGTGEKDLYYNGVRVAVNNSWYPNEVVDLYYDGTNYQAKSCADTLEYDVSLHQTHEITEIITTTRTLIFNGDVTSNWESKTPVSNSSVKRYTRSETNTGQDVDSTTVDGPHKTYDSTTNETTVVYITTHTYTHFVNNYTFDEAVNAVPEAYKHGGLKLRFISSNKSGQSSGNKYVQYRLMTDSWSTTESDWQGVDDEPTRGSRNVVESGGAFDFANRVILVKYWGNFTPSTFPTPQLGQYLYNTREHTLYVGEIDPVASTGEEDVVVWNEINLKDHTIYINGDTFVSYIWDGEAMKPITKFLMVIDEDSETTGENILPNILYRWGSMHEITVSWSANDIEGYVNEYMIEFTVDGDGFTLTLPEGVRWVDEPTWEDGYTYQVSIVDNLAVYAGWEAPEENE